MHQIYGNSFGQYPVKGQIDRQIIRSSDGMSQRSGGERLSSIGLSACKKVRFHSPYIRLARRLEFERTLGELIPKDSSGIDNFSLFDAVMKRGGYELVCERRRWEEININLIYQKNCFKFIKHYSQVLLPLQKDLNFRLNWYKNQYKEETFEVHLLPANSLTPNYYHLTSSEMAFAQGNFSSFDEYYNIKTIVSQKVSYQKIAVEYADKIFMARKWLLFSHPLQVISQQESILLGAFEPPKFTVLIMGIGLPSLLVANKLSDFGINVVIVDKTRNEQRLKDQFQILSNGLMVLEGGRQVGSYYDTLRSNYCTVEEIGSTMQFLDDEGKPFLDEKVRASEEQFAGILDELRSQNMNRRNLYEEIISRVLKKKLQHQRFLIKWHHDRYMLVNKIKGDQTSVAELASYESKKFVKHVAQKHTMAYMRSCQPLYHKLKAKKNVKFSMGVIESINYNGCWDIKMVKESLRGTHLIYADQQGACRGLLQGSSRFAQFNHELLGDEGATALGQLTAIRYLNCYFRFQNPIQLRDCTPPTSFSMHCQYGFIYCFMLEGGHQILSTVKCYHSSNINYYQQVLKALQSRGITRGNRLQTEQVNWVEYTFGLKDEKLIQNMIRIRQQQKMFLMLPITTTNSAHRTAANLDLANYIASAILHEAYPHNSKCGPANLSLFEPNNNKILAPSQPTKPNPAPPSSLHKTNSQGPPPPLLNISRTISQSSLPAPSPIVNKISSQGVLPPPAPSSIVNKISSQGVLPPPAPSSIVNKISSQGVLPPPAPSPIVNKISSQSVLPPSAQAIVRDPLPHIEKFRSFTSIAQGVGSMHKQDSISVTPLKRQPQPCAQTISAPISKNFPVQAQQQHLKVRMITSAPHESTQITPQSAQNDIPSIEELHKRNPDWFGLQHHYVRNHELYLANRIIKKQNLVEALACFETLEVEKSIGLHRGLTLCSLGRPCVKSSDWAGNAIFGANSEGEAWLLAGMVTRREYFSLWDTFRTTVYYQTILVHNENIYFCIADQEHPELIFYHSHLQTLINKFNARLQQARRDQLNELTLRKSYSNVQVTRNRPSPRPPSQLLPSHINQIISQQTWSKSDVRSLDLILEGKLNKDYQQAHTKKFMGGQLPDPDKKVDVSSAVALDQTLLVLSQVKQFLVSSCELHQLKSFSLFEVFFGVLSDQYIACQISRKFTLSPLSFIEVTNMDESLGKEMEDIFLKSILNQINSILIIPSDKQVLTTRNFVDCRQHKSFQGYSYLMLMKGEQSREHWLICQGLKERFDCKEQMMVRIVQQLLQHHSSDYIVGAFRDLISKQVNGQKSMSPRIAMYYHMTKKQNKFRPNNLKTLTDRCQQIKPEQRQKARAMMKAGRIRWVENEFVYVIE